MTDPGIETPDRPEWRHLMAELAGGDRAELAVGPLVKLGGGALHHHWRLDIEHEGRVERFVLRCTASRVLDSLSRGDEFAAHRAAFEAGVLTPEPLAHGADFVLMRHAPGTADPAAALAVPDPDALAQALAESLARLHTVRPQTSPLPGLGTPPADAALARLAAYRAALDRRDRAYAVLEWGLRALTVRQPAPAAPVLCHGDFRTGNYLVEAGALTGVLDWEYAGWSDPDEDLGWFCARYWRRHQGDREAGGLVGRAAFFAHYAHASGRAVDPRRVLYWELMANVRWALIALEQADRGVAEGLLLRALTGRRLAEIEAEILTLADGWLAADA
jgi:aminoglycoside phosphotransferase (APT) family kinase protein